MYPSTQETTVTNLRKSFEVHQNLTHLFGEHFLEVFISPHELDKHHRVPRLGAVQIVGILKDAGPGLNNCLISIRLNRPTGSQKAASDQNLQENLAVTTIVKLVASRVKELENSIEVQADLRGLL